MRPFYILLRTDKRTRYVVVAQETRKGNILYVAVPTSASLPGFEYVTSEELFRDYVFAGFFI